VPLSLQDAERKVLAAAEAEARKLVEDAEAEARAEFDRRAAALREEQQRAIAAAKAEADAALERDLHGRRAQHTMKLLEAKNEMLASVFEAVRERALASQGFDYPRWLAAQVRRACAKGRGTLYCAERDRAAVEALVREAGAADRISVSMEPGSMRGGAYLVGDRLDLDLTLDAALRDLADEGAVDIAQRLFADVPPIGAALAGGG